MGTSDGPRKPHERPEYLSDAVTEITEGIQGGIESLTELQRAATIGMRGVNQKAESYKDTTVDLALIASNKIPHALQGEASASGETSVSNQNGTISIKPSAAVSSDQEKDKAKFVHSAVLGVTILAEAAWNFYFGTAMPEELKNLVSLFIVAAPWGGTFLYLNRKV